MLQAAFFRYSIIGKESDGVNNRLFRSACTLLLALILAVVPFSGLNNTAQAAEFITDPNIPMPWGVRWIGDFTVEWQKPYDYTSSKELNYNVKLVIYSSTSTSSRVNSIEYVAMKGYQFTFPKDNFYNGKYYYQVQVTTVGSDANYCSPMAFTERVQGIELGKGHVSPYTEYLDGTIELRVNKKYTGANRVNLDIDRENFISPGDPLPAYDQVSVFGSLPKGMEWKYGEAETPYVAGTPTETGLSSAEFLVHLSNGQNIIIYEEFMVLPESMWNRQEFVVEKGKAITAVRPVFTGQKISGISIYDGALPPGLNLSLTANPPKITGTPTAIGKYSITLSGWDQYQYEYYDLITFLVTEMAGAYSDDWLLYQGKAYDFALNPRISGQFVSAELVLDSLPKGLTWNYSETEGVRISGTPTVTGTFSPTFKIISATGQYSRITMNITVGNDNKASDLYEVNMTGGQISMSKTEYQKFLAGTLDAAVKGQQIWKEDVTLTIGGAKVIVAYYDFDGDNKSDLLVTPVNNAYIVSQAMGNYKKDDYFLDLNEASLYAAKNGSADYAKTVAFRVKKPEPGNPFKDIAKGTYCYDPVLWAVNRNPQITNGLSSSEFGPDAKCTRAQIVTFLWRAAGCPEPKKTTSKFKDVDLSSTSWYGKAVLWAVENNITSGESDTAFNPNGVCKREHVVTFLWRYSGMQAMANTECAFTDVDHSQYYFPALIWAVRYNIAKGLDKKTFGPDKPCTRGQIVTFLYRLLYSYNVLEKDDFLLYASTVGKNANGTPYIEGKIVNGSVRFGSRVRVLSYDSQEKKATDQTVVVIGMKVKKSDVWKTANSGSKGDTVELTFRKESEDLHTTWGCAAVGVNTDLRSVDTNVWGTVSINNTSDSRNVLKENMAAGIALTPAVNGRVAAIEGGQLNKGQTGKNVLWAEFEKPLVLYAGQEVAVMNGSWRCGTMTVTKVGP